jgi:mannitol/fructose-specific phosphotransferase system IIA component (Ntr-type)
MDLSQHITTDRIVFFQDTTKKQALKALVDTVGKSGKVSDIGDMEEKIFYREKLMSTGIGLGIAIPHIRYEKASEPLIAVGICPDGIEDYESIDGKPVYVIIMIVVPQNQHKQHLDIMAQVVKKLKNPDTMIQLKSSDSVNQVLGILCQTSG